VHLPAYFSLLVLPPLSLDCLASPRTLPCPAEELSDDDDGVQYSGLEEKQSVYDGPAVWGDVDVEELERIAVHISRTAMPATENSELATRLAMQVQSITGSGC
jgi:hypothetical protein